MRIAMRDASSVLPSHLHTLTGTLPAVSLRSVNTGADIGVTFIVPTTRDCLHWQLLERHRYTTQHTVAGTACNHPSQSALPRCSPIPVYNRPPPPPVLQCHEIPPPPPISYPLRPSPDSGPAETIFILVVSPYSGDAYHHHYTNKQRANLRRKLTKRRPTHVPAHV